MLNRHLGLACYEEAQSEQWDSRRMCGVVCESGGVYTPRNAEESTLYSVVSENLETFLAVQQQRERTVPRFVERELRAFLECGIWAHGRLRILSFIDNPCIIEKILRHLKLWDLPERSPPQPFNNNGT